MTYTDVIEPKQTIKTTPPRAYSLTSHRNHRYTQRLAFSLKSGYSFSFHDITFRAPTTFCSSTSTSGRATCVTIVQAGALQLLTVWRLLQPQYSYRTQGRGSPERRPVPHVAATCMRAWHRTARPRALVHTCSSMRSDLEVDCRMQNTFFIHRHKLNHRRL